MQNTDRGYYSVFKTKTKSIVAFCIAILLLAAVSVLSLFGVGDFKGAMDEGGINKGLDLVGGSLIVYEADVEGTPDDLAENMAAVKSMMRSRLDTLGYTEANVVLVGDRRIQIEIPNISDPEEAVQKLGATAKLEFRNSEGTVVLEGSDIKNATAAFGDPTGNGYEMWYVGLTLDDSAVEKFADATEYVISNMTGANRYIAIYLDEDQLSKPSVSSRISSANVSITGNYDQESASYLAGIISAGKLPFALKDIHLKSVGPSLGERAFDTSIIAGGIGILLVILFMIIVYRMPGVMASLSLVAYSAIFILIICGFQLNLSLSGIAGIILSIGMAVDANVVIFERIKEELRNGKSTKAAVASGFKRALTAVIDSNVTTLIASGVLWYFGTGSIQGFAITLFVGVLLSMLTAVVLTRFFLYDLVGMRVTNPALYGVKPAAENK